MINLYFYLGGCGDNYFGLILAGLDPNDISSGDLPAHFEKNMDDKIIEKGMMCMYGNFVWSHLNSVSILLLCPASIVDHIDFVKDVIDKDPGHIFQ